MIFYREIWSHTTEMPCFHFEMKLMFFLLKKAKKVIFVETVVCPHNRTSKIDTATQHFSLLQTLRIVAVVVNVSDIGRLLVHKFPLKVTMFTLKASFFHSCLNSISACIG